MADDVNIFDAAPAQRRPVVKEPAPASSEDDDGARVVPLRRRKAERIGWKDQWQVSESGSPLPNLFNCLLAMRFHPRLAGLVMQDDMENVAMVMRAVPDGEIEP